MAISIGVAYGIPRHASEFSASPPAFTPLALSPIVWLDGADGATVWQDTGGTVPAAFDADPIGLWQDKSGAGNHVSQATGSAKPARSSLATPSSLAFGGTQRMTRSSLTGGAQAQPLTVALVGFNVSNSTIFFASSTGGSQISRGTTATTLTANWGAALTDTSVPDLSGRKAILVEVNGASSRLEVGGVLETTGNAGALTTDRLNVGASNVGSAFMTGEICEIVVVGRILTVGEKASLQAYFAAKWSV